MTKTLFNHINQIVEIQNKDYWNSLSGADKKTWSNYMIHRFLSMNINWIEIVNEFQQYNLHPKILYKLYIDVLPKRKQWLRYIKKHKKNTYPGWLIEKISEYYEINNAESESYISLFYSTPDGKLELKKILELYGTEPKIIHKLKLT